MANPTLCVGTERLGGVSAQVHLGAGSPHPLSPLTLWRERPSQYVERPLSHKRLFGFETYIPFTYRK